MVPVQLYHNCRGFLRTVEVPKTKKGCSVPGASATTVRSFCAAQMHEGMKGCQWAAHIAGPQRDWPEVIEHVRHLHQHPRVCMAALSAAAVTLMSARNCDVCTQL
jgi:hypothetical protein